MADIFSYLSVLNPGWTAAPGTSTASRAGSFAYVSILNPNIATTVTATIGATSFSNSNNVSFGLVGSTVTATAGPWPRSVAWSNLGVWVGTGSPGPGVMYADWLAGAPGYFMWVRIP